ncbi:MAG: phosphatidylserine decarboxylase family protein [bacterium]
MEKEIMGAGQTDFSRKLPVAKEGIQIAFYFIFGAIIAFYLNLKIPGFIFVFFAGFVLFFFRDPDRVSPEGDNLILSPADGTVIEIEKVKEDKFLKTDSLKVSIFLSIFNVHINRSPVSGKIKYFEYQKGKFLIASKKEATDKNEKNIIGIEGKRFNLLVYQITGLIARRVVFWLGMEDNVSAGERIGLMKFGSRMDVFCPINTQIKVKIGDKVRAGESILGVVG